MHIALATRHSLRQVIAHGLIGASIAFAVAFIVDSSSLGAHAHDAASTTTATTNDVELADPAPAEHDVGPHEDVQYASVVRESARITTMDGVDHLMATERIVPAFKDGRTIGFKVFSIRPTSFLAVAGLKNGDVVTRVNGIDLADYLRDPSKGLELYTKFKDVRVVVVDIIRNGQNAKLTIDTAAF